MSSRVIGIDLGTSNCAVAYVDPSKGAGAPVIDVPVMQVVRPGEVSARGLLPSAIYSPANGEFPAGALELPAPFGAAPFVVGEFARWQGARVPGRVITSAKSWLIHDGVDRQAPLLPWGAPADVPKMSPVAAQSALLKHIASAWNQAQPELPFVQQDVVLTIPASFDEAASALTLQAARDAGFDLNRVSLLEEPQAAFYDFTSRHRTRLADALKGARLVLVVDVGGGTTDFSLVQVAMLPEGPALKRIAVGDHVLLGGDNMDATLARAIETKALGGTNRFSATQWSQAIQAARLAKETLLSVNAPASTNVTLASTGSRLIGSTISVEVTQQEAQQLIVDGFFPAVNHQSVPASARRGGVVELGLPYATEPAITRHIIAFLKAHAAAGFTALNEPAPTPAALPRPDAILLNGGVFNSTRLAEALQRAVSNVWPESPRIPLLPHDSLDLAVARGAAYSGIAKRALGQKIGGGAPRAFYVVTGNTTPPQGVCIIPRGLEEGEAVSLKDRRFTLTLGRPVQFQLYSTTADRLDAPGDLVSLTDELFQPLPPIHSVLRSQTVATDPKKKDGVTLPVSLEATLSEVGTLALNCVSDSERWRLEFELRGSSNKSDFGIVESMPGRMPEAVLEIERVFGTKPLPVEPKDVKRLFATLERILGEREKWSVAVLRELWTQTYAGVSKRRRSIDHEKVMLQLLGYTLRPGRGYPLDTWRCEQTFSVFKDLVTNHSEQPVWAEFWVLWRRIAAGLSETQQRTIWDYARPTLLRKVPLDLPPPTEKLKGVQPQALDELVKCVASLELLSPVLKTELGEWIVSRLKSPETAGGPWAWALGRLGARVPVQGASHQVVSIETAEQWVQLLLTLDPKRHDAALFALAQLTRRTGDRSRDLDEALRTKVLERLATFKVSESWSAMVRDVVELSAGDEARALGDTLPIGLSLH